MRIIKRGYIPTYSLLPVILATIIATIVIGGQICGLERDLEYKWVNIAHRMPQVKFEVVEAIVTAYSPEESQTDDRPWEMASGKTVYLGAIACPIMLNFGDLVEIDGKIYTCEDRMAKRYRDKWRFDILMKDKQSALRWGKQTKQILIY